MTKNTFSKSAIPRYVAPGIRLFKVSSGKMFLASCGSVSIDDWGSGANLDFQSDKGNASIDDWQNGVNLDF